MGSCYDHPSPIQVKYGIRKYLLGRGAALVGQNYNTERECVDVSHPNSDSNRNTASKDESLNQELCLSAMLFTTLDVKESETESEDINDFEVVF